MAVQLTLLDGDTGGKRSSLELLAGGVQGLPNGLPSGTVTNQPLVWDGTAWVPAPGPVAVSSVNSRDGLSSSIEFPDATPGFSTVARWTVESANVFQVERDNVLFRRRIVCIGETLNPLEMIAPDVGGPLIGFLGAVPVVRQVLTASLADPQAQINDIVTALVNLGLVTDSRVP